MFFLYPWRRPRKIDLVAFQNAGSIVKPLGRIMVSTDNEQRNSRGNLRKRGQKFIEDGDRFR